MTWRCGGCCAGGGAPSDNLTNNYQPGDYELLASDIGTNTCVVISGGGIVTIPSVATLGVAPADGAVVYVQALTPDIVTIAHELGPSFILSPYDKTDLAPTAGARAMLCYHGDDRADEWSLEGNLA